MGVGAVKANKITTSTNTLSQGFIYIFTLCPSSLSTGLNSMAAVVLEDFYKTCFKKKLTDEQTYILMKSSVVVLGVICVVLVFLVEKMGAVLQVNHNNKSIVMSCE